MSRVFGEGPECLQQFGIAVSIQPHPGLSEKRFGVTTQVEGEVLWL
jgi:hypothetical protein